MALQWMARGVLVGLTFGLSAFGSTITIFNTGESSSDTALPVGTTDPNYTLVSAPSGVPLTAITTTPNSAWVSNLPTADWISPGSSGNTAWAAGNYDYETTFSLAGMNPATAELSGSWTSDNAGCIYLNGVNTGNCTTASNYGSLVAFSITSGFVSGVNTLDFIVNNTPPSTSPTGLFVEISGTAASVTPEPSSLVLLCSGLLGLGAIVRARRARSSAHL